MADSGDSSPHSAADDAHHPDHNATNNSPEAAPAPAAASVAPAAVAAPPQPQVPAKVRLMVSYGGRIQPRPHDNQLSYVNGDTKILCIERPLRFPDFAARLAALAGTSRDGLCVKYQLPGEDLDALVSVTNDEDLDHLVIEYDRLHLFRPSAAPGSGGGASSRGAGGGSTPRLRVFLFPVQPPRPLSPPAALMPKPEHREWYLDLKSVSPPPPPQALPPPQLHQNHQPQMRQETVPVQSPPPAAAVPMAVPQSVMVASQTGPDYLFGFDYGFMPPPAVKVKDPAGDPPKTRDNVPVEIPPKNEDRHPNPEAADNNNNAMPSPAVSPAEFPRQIPDIDKLQLADYATQQQPPAPAPAPAPATPVAPAPAPAPVVAPAAPVAAPLSRNGSDDSLTRAYPPATATPTAAAEYYVSKFPEKPPVPPPSSAPPPAAYLPVPGRYASVAPGSGAEAGPFFFIPAPPHGYFATSANPGGTSYYAVAPHNGNANGNGNCAAPAPAVSSAQAYPQVAYDSNGRAIYYTGLLPQYPSAVNGGMSASTAVLGNEPPKPVAVKPTVS